MIEAGRHYTIHNGPRSTDGVVRYADDDVVVVIEGDGRPGVYRPDEFERITKPAAPPREFWVTMLYDRINDEWVIASSGREDLDLPAEHHHDNHREGYAVKVRVVGHSPVPHASQPRLNNVLAT